MAKQKKVKFPKLPYFHVPLFGGHLYLATSHEKAVQALKALGRPTESEKWLSKGVGLTCDLVNPDTGILLNLIGVFDGTLQTLMHEINHATFNVMDHVGVETGEGNRETFCYLSDAIFAAFAPHIKKVKDKK